MHYTTFSTMLEGPVLTVRLDHGETNILSGLMAVELHALAAELAGNTTTRVVVFESANPDFFIAHFSVSDILQAVSAAEPAAAVEADQKNAELNILQTLGLAMTELPQVSIAKVDGVCRGGGFEFVLALDMCFATERARFCFPEAAAGFLPAGGGSTLLPLHAGERRALEVMLSCRDFSGGEAQQYGFINRSFDSAQAMQAYVAELTGRIGGRSAQVTRAIKSVIATSRASQKTDLLAALVQENTAMADCFTDPLVLERLRRLAHIEGSREVELDLPATLAGF